jgi:hypothetical protein
VRLSPLTAHLWINLGCAVAALGHIDLARQCYERVRPVPQGLDDPGC